MNDDEAWGEAEKETDAELDGKLKSLTLADLAKAKELLPEGPDREKYDAFMAKADAETDANKRKQAYIDLFKNISEVGAKALEQGLKISKKALTSGLLLMLLIPSLASAAILDLSGPMDWIKEASELSRGGLAINFKAKTGGIAYLPLAWDKKRGYWDVGIGYTHFEGGVNHGTGVFGFNLVRTSHDLLKNMFSDGVGILPLGDIWIGPYVEAPPLDNIKEPWVVGERTGIQMSYKFIGLFGGK